MFEWFFVPYIRFLQGLHFILIPGNGPAPADLLRALMLFLCIAAVLRIVTHYFADRRLRSRSPIYGPREFSGLNDLYREAGRLVGLKRLPPLHRYADEGPLAFTSGVFSPAVFLAPVVIHSLGPEELRAVLVHELVHVRRRDTLRSWLAGFFPITALVVLPQVIALHVLFVRMAKPIDFAFACTLVALVLALLLAFRSIVWPRLIFRRELDCDDRVVKAQQDPLVVAASLVKVWRLQKDLPRGPAARWIHAQPLLRTSSSVERRVRRLMDYRPSPLRAWLTTTRRVATTAVLVWTALFLWAFHNSNRRFRPFHVPSASALTRR